MSAPTSPVPEPSELLTDPHELLAAYLDYYRATILRKLDGLSERELRSSRLPSGWTPLTLLKHLAYVERRWLRWGFLAEQVDQPWGDQGPDGAWLVAPEETTGQVKALFEDQWARSREIVAAARLEEVARSGGRFNPPDPRPALVWILFHLLQEYARHAGQLDVVRELADGAVGE
jgi:uncharacterized damage-inducible protein DinB